MARIERYFPESHSAPRVDDKKVLSQDHLHVFVTQSLGKWFTELFSDFLHMPKLAVSNLARKMKGYSSHEVQRDFPELKKRYWGRHFWGRGVSSVLSKKTRPSPSPPYGLWKFSRILDNAYNLDLSENAP